MLFAPDTETALRSLVNLINTAANGTESLTGVAELRAFLDVEGFTGSREGSEAELQSVKRLRSQLAALWTANEETAAKGVNQILTDARALPQLAKHDHLDWHLHATPQDAPLADRMGTEAAMALVDVIRSKEMDRLRVCAADDCDAAVLDLSRNRSKLYCDTGNCANRTHVAAYRARKASGSE
ncbi:CGNR zinc finger domain-containing protein [Arthrobacter sp. NyZ413]|uniref:CGNR zinc finger domain-containing protein n=1 Tax=Arthrobacter sp. NyZ413 TaxID=3144669 RepID=UPI002C08E445|nr:CGNR zinc finger domain-containing protein [Arthrobacter sp.]